VSRLGAYVASLSPELPRAVWLLEAGFFINAFGTGIAYPFLVIYLHNVRGISLGTAGLVIALSGAAGLLSGPLFGRLVDRVGARVTLATALVLGACAYGLFPLVHDVWAAFLVALLVGLSSGSFWPSQSTLLTGLAPPARRHAAFAVQRGMFNLGLGLGATTGGLIATTADPSTFTVLFLVDAAATLGFCAVVPFIPDPGFHRRSTERERPQGGYRDVIRNRPFMGLIALNVVFVSAGYTQLELLPVFAKNQAGVSEQAIGLIFLASSAALVVCQLPIAKLVEGRARMRALAVMPAVWALAWLGVAAGGAWLETETAAAIFAVAAVAFAVGECLDGPTRIALIADLVPVHLQGRHWALSANSWDIGYIIGPAVGGFVLAAQPLALWPLAAAVCIAATLGTLAMERVIPVALRLTPGGNPRPTQAAEPAT
jgi:predicted MFS family arabinose efflux permease